jgi:predicted DsbA family dithiol-disulfide isomerase
VLVELAETAGVDLEDVHSALNDKTLREEIRRQFSAAQQQGLTGVPTFAYGG